MADAPEELDRLAQALLDQGRLTREQVDKALEFQRDFGAGFAQVVVKLGYISERDLIEFMAKEQGLEVVDVDELILPENLIKRLPRKLIEKHTVLPIEYHNGVLTVVCSDPYDMAALDEIQMALDARVKLALAPRSSIRKVIQEHFGTSERKPAADLSGALIPLLIEKGLITEEELRAKARELGLLP